jgi:hypothetical protein
MQSGDKIDTLAGFPVELPYAREHPCFGQRQGWCKNLATWRMEGPYLMLHWCDACKKHSRFTGAENKWIGLEQRPRSAWLGGEL